MTAPATPQPRRLPMAWLAFATGVVPMIVVHAAYLGSAVGGHIPLCFPYLEGCTSISASGRYGMAYFFFKGGMIPAAALMAAFWWLSREWLLANGDRDGRMIRAMAIIGCVAAAFLVLYTVFLGSRGDFYNLMRRYGVTIYFSFSYLAQLILTGRVRALQSSGRMALPSWLPRAMLGSCVLLLAIGLGSIPISNFVADKDRPENAVEWIFSLLLASYYLLAWIAWRRTGFAVQPVGRQPLD